MANEKIPIKHICEPCNYITDNKKDYNKHLMTAKHIRLTDTNDKSQECYSYMCISCGNSYKHAPSLCKHKKKCKGPGQETSETTVPKPEEMMALMFKFMCDKLPDKADQSQLVIELLKQNQDFKELMLEQSKQLAEQQQLLLEAVKDGKLGNTNNNCNNNNTTTNNKFNLNVFLNETCKDAITMDDFINSIEVTRDEFILISTSMTSSLLDHFVIFFSTSVFSSVLLFLFNELIFISTSVFSASLNEIIFISATMTTTSLDKIIRSWDFSSYSEWQLKSEL